jgi:hypothetical protein
MMWSVHSRSEFRLPQRAGRHSKQRIINGQPRLLSQIVDLLAPRPNPWIHRSAAFGSGLRSPSSPNSHSPISARSHTAVIINQPIRSKSSSKTRSRYQKCTDSPPPGPIERPKCVQQPLRVRSVPPHRGNAHSQISARSQCTITMPSSEINQSDPNQVPQMHRQSPPRPNPCIQTPAAFGSGLRSPSSGECAFANLCQITMHDHNARSQCSHHQLTNPIQNKVQNKVKVPKMHTQSPPWPHPAPETRPAAAFGSGFRSPLSGECAFANLCKITQCSHLINQPTTDSPVRSKKRSKDARTVPPLAPSSARNASSSRFGSGFPRGTLAQQSSTASRSKSPARTASHHWKSRERVSRVTVRVPLERTTSTNWGGD